MGWQGIAQRSKYHRQRLYVSRTFGTVRADQHERASMRSRAGTLPQPRQLRASTRLHPEFQPLQLLPE